MARGKPNATGRGEKLAAFTPMLHHVVDSPAFQSLTPLAECLYWRLCRRAGYKGSRNGEVFYSVREVATEFAVNKDTASAAFHLLQARGFIVPTRIGSLGIEGQGRATTWRLTDFPVPGDPRPTREYQSWQPGHDFPVKKSRPPLHRKQKPVPLSRTPCPSGPDVDVVESAEVGRACPSQSDVRADLGAEPVRLTGTPKELPGARERGS